MKQINRDWLESYKQIPRTDNTIYKNIYNPHEYSIQGTPLSHFEKGALPAYGMGTQEMEQQLRAHPAFSSLPPEVRDLPLSEMFNYFKTPEMRNRIKFNQGLESLRNQREQNYNTQLKGLETQNNQKLAAIKAREQEAARVAQQLSQQRAQQLAQRQRTQSPPQSNNISSQISSIEDTIRAVEAELQRSLNSASTRANAQIRYNNWLPQKAQYEKQLNQLRSQLRK